MHFATIVKDLSGDWFTEIACNSIQNEPRKYFDELVYFGPASDLVRGGQSEYLLQASRVDRYLFDQHQVGFYYNTDPDCARNMRLHPDERHVIIYNGNNALPTHILVD